MSEQSTSREINKEASICKSLFLGNIIEENMFPYPEMDSDEAETVAMIVETVDRFMAENAENIINFDREGAQSEAYINALKEMGLFSLIIPEEYGGMGLSSSGYARVMQQVSRYDGSTAITIGAHSSIGMKGLLLFGSDEQKKRYLPKLASGEMVAAFCLTESGSGSDAASISTSAVRQENGDWLLNGEKIWISNGAFAEFFTVFARTDSEQGKISAFIVERSYTGVSTGPKEDKMGIRGSATTTVVLENVTVPAANLLGEEGKGFKLAMEILNNGRTGLGGGAIGAMKACIALANQQSSERKQFDKPICEFELVREKLAQMTVDCFTAEAAVAVLANLIDSGVADYSCEAAICKVYASEALWRTANEALQIAGGNGFMKEYPYERIVRDCRINMIFEGTNEILRLFTALTGLKDAGTQLKEIGATLGGKIFDDPIKGFGIMSGYASKKLSHLTGLGGERLAVDERLRKAARVFEIGTQGLARESENALKTYRKGIITEQLVCKRLANAAIDLFVGFSSISRVQSLIEKKGAQNCDTELSIINLFAEQAKKRLKANLLSDPDSEKSEIAKIAEHGLQNSYSWDSI